MFELIISILISWQTLKPNITETNQTKTQIIKLDSSRPYLQGTAGLVADLNSDTILYQKNGLKKLQIASLTKLMTALIIIQEHKLNEIVTVPSEATAVGGSIINLSPNETVTVKDLLSGLLMQSGNDAAATLAIFNAGSIPDFVIKMNQKAKELNLANTSFSNPIGFDDKNNYSTVQDLYVLAKSVYQYPEIRKIAATKEKTIYSTDKKYSHNIHTTNQILDNYLEIKGLKTGTTTQAGGCFIGITNANNRPTISIVLGSTNRFLDTKIMLDWAKNTFKYK